MYMKRFVEEKYVKGGRCKLFGVDIKSEVGRGRSYQLPGKLRKNKQLADFRETSH